MVMHNAGTHEYAGPVQDREALPLAGTLGSTGLYGALHGDGDLDDAVRIPRPREADTGNVGWHAGEESLPAAAALQDSEPVQPYVALAPDARFKVLGGLQSDQESPNRLTAAQARQVGQYFPMVNHILNKMQIFEWQRDDLFQVGVMGLIEAVQRYDATQASLTTFVYMRIYGEIIDWIRQQSPVTRSVVKQGKKITELRDDGADDARICEEMDITPELLQRVEHEYKNRNSISLDTPVADNATLADVVLTGAVERGYDKVERGAQQFADCVAEILTSHDVTPRDIALMREHLQGANMTEIAKKYGLTLSRVSQIVKRTADTLREHVKTGDTYGEQLAAFAA